MLPPARMGKVFGWRQMEHTDAEIDDLLIERVRDTIRQSRLLAKEGQRIARQSVIDSRQMIYRAQPAVIPPAQK